MFHEHVSPSMLTLFLYAWPCYVLMFGAIGEIWGSCCVPCSSAASRWLLRSCSATFETAVASKSGTALFSCMWERCRPKAENAVVLNRLFSDYFHGELLSQNFGAAVTPHTGNAAFPKQESCRHRHRARCGLLFNATALPLGAAAAPNFFPWVSIR